MAGRRTTKRPEPLLQQNQPAQNKNFDWGKAYMRDLTTTNAQGVPRIIAGTEGGATASDLIQSGKNISQGEGGFLDWASVLLAPTAFAGYGAFKAAPAVAAGVKAGARTVDNAAAQAIINRTIKNPQMSIALPPKAMEGVARGDKVKNMFEMADDPSLNLRQNGYLDERAAVESNLLGIGADVPAAQRPTYGVMSSGIDLPYYMANRAPGATGEALRLFDPRFNNILNRYSMPTSKNGSALSPNGFLRTNPGVKGSYTISDSFHTPDRAFTIGNQADQNEAAQKIFNLARQNADYKSSEPWGRNFPNSLPGLRQPAGQKVGINAIGDIGNRQMSYPYIELQAAAETNPASLMRKLELSDTRLGGKTIGGRAISNVPTSSIGRDPQAVETIRKLLLTATYSPAGRRLDKLNYNRQQAVQKLLRRLKELGEVPPNQQTPDKLSIRPGINLDEL